MDLDRFRELVKVRGWSEYTPNPVTGRLTELVQQFVLKWFAVVIYGLDPERGTEEVVLELPGVKFEAIEEDLRKIIDEIRGLGASISIGVSYGLVTGREALTRREAYYGTPTRRRAVRALREAKRMGGGKIIFK